MTSARYLMNWSAVLLAVVGLFFLYLGLRDWLHKRRYPARSGSNEELPNHDHRFSLRGLK
jgi:hypothetical protein